MTIEVEHSSRETGRYLAHLRDEAGLKQNELTQKGDLESSGALSR